MDATTIIGIAGFAILVATTAVQTARAAYFLGKFEQAEETLKLERDRKSGWEDEAKFWRNVAFPEAETKRIENE